MIVKLEYVDIVVGHEAETWVKGYTDLLYDEPTHPLFTRRRVGELQVANYDDNEQYRKFLTDPEFAKRLSKAEIFQLAIKNCTVDMLHVTEKAANTHMGSMCLLAAEESGVLTVIIPTNLEVDLLTPAEAMR